MVKEPEKKRSVQQETLYARPQVLLQWSAPARRFSKKGPAWFAVLVLVTAVLFVLLLLFVHWSMAFLVLALAFVLFVWYYFEPGQASYQVLNTGIKIDKEQFLFEDLRFFWIDGQKGVRTLHFASYRNFPPYLSLVLAESVDLEKLEEELLKHLPYHQSQQKDWVGLLEELFEGLSAHLPPGLVKVYEKTLHRSASFVSARLARP